MAAAADPEPIPKINCAIPRVSISKLPHCVDSIVDNLQAMKQLSIPKVLSINVVSIIVGSFVNMVDFDRGMLDIPSQQDPYHPPRNHECSAFVRNLLQNPGSQFAPAFLEHLWQNKMDTININQYMFLIDPMYSQEQNTIPNGLASVFPSILHNPIISTNGFIVNDALLPAPIIYNSFLEPYIIPHDVDEVCVDNIIAQFQTLGSSSLLINLMDCTSNILRKLWVQNTNTNVYLAMPDCLAKDNTPMYMPVITYATDAVGAAIGCRWVNWALDKEFTSLFELISPHTYEFLIHNYKRMAIETYFIPICKILSRMRVSVEYELDDIKSIVFSKMSFQEFKYLWIHKREKFAPLFMSYMEPYYKWNHYKFIEILIASHSDSEEPSMQKILQRYIEEHLQQLKAFFPTETIRTYGDTNVHLLITSYLRENGSY